MVVFEARKAAELDKIFEAMSVNRPDGILLPTDFLILEQKDKIAKGVRSVPETLLVRADEVIR